MKENDIRPQNLFDELLRLNKLDIQKCFKNAKVIEIKCPACNARGTYSFTKNGFKFDECETCKSLYVSPRPHKRYFDAYYSDSESTKYWATTFYKKTEKNRREMLWKPKAKIIKEKINFFLLKTDTIIDIGGGYGTFIEEFLKILKINHLIIEPSKHLVKICEKKKLNVIENFLENIHKKDLPKFPKTFVSFELFEHLHNPRAFLEILYNLMDSGDSFIFTTLSGMGADIQVLWQDSKSISPPMHLNFLNPKSVEILLKDIGFKVLETSTPGKLDLDIMKNNIDKIKDKFWKNFLDYSTTQEQNNMQKIISENKLSSHMMVVCKKI